MKFAPNSATQSSHCVDGAGWQDKVASIEIWMQWHNAHSPHYTPLMGTNMVVQAGKHRQLTTNAPLCSPQESECKVWENLTQSVAKQHIRPHFMHAEQPEKTELDS